MPPGPDPTLTLAIETSNPASGGGSRGISGRGSSEVPPSGGAEGGAGTGPAGAHRDTAGVALTAGQGSTCSVLGTVRLAPASRHDDALAPAIDTLCRNAGVRPCEIARVAVSVGPGGFTAVRIAVATGQMIALASGAACFAVPTALGVAYSMSSELPPGSRATILLAWKRGDSWRHRFERRADGHWTELNGGVLTPLSKPVEPGDALVCDEAIREMVHSGPASWLAPRFDPVGIARASWQMKPMDAALLLPLYPREPEAVTKWRELGRG